MGGGGQWFAWVMYGDAGHEGGCSVMLTKADVDILKLSIKLLS